MFRVPFYINFGIKSCCLDNLWVFDNIYISTLYFGYPSPLSCNSTPHLTTPFHVYTSQQKPFAAYICIYTHLSRTAIDRSIKITRYFLCFLNCGYISKSAKIFFSSVRRCYRSANNNIKLQYNVIDMAFIKRL